MLVVHSYSGIIAVHLVKVLLQGAFAVASGVGIAEILSKLKLLSTHVSERRPIVVHMHVHVAHRLLQLLLLHEPLLCGQRRRARRRHAERVGL